MASPFIELEVGERVVKLTNPDKVLFPKARKTKRDLADYYLAVGEGIVRALYERPTQLRRFPDGVTGEAIYQKRVPEKRPEWVEAARVTFPSGRHADELCVTELAQVIWAANLAVVDFHPWPSRRRDTEHPDELRIDIDPQPGTTFRDGKKVAALVREVLGHVAHAGLCGAPAETRGQAHEAQRLVRGGIPDEPRQLFFHIRLEQHGELAEFLRDLGVAANGHIATLDDFFGMRTCERGKIQQAAGDVGVRRLPLHGFPGEAD